MSSNSTYKVTSEKTVNLELIIAKGKGYRVVSHSIMPHGTCNVCMGKKEENKLSVGNTVATIIVAVVN